jgi:excisionase family DNA binding protein
MNATTLWSLVPKHLQTLLALGTEEVAQNSYKRGFKESRLELIQRLLDPTLTLEETARLLNVCPTTVRRYTNRGLLTHQRTPGDQRRFKLSDVLAFLEAQSQSTK